MNMNKNISYTRYITTKLTNREFEIIVCLADGLTTSETASRLFLSHETIKSHRSRLMQKLDARNAFQLGIFVMKYNLLESRAKASF